MPTRREKRQKVWMPALETVRVLRCKAISHPPGKEVVRRGGETPPQPKVRRSGVLWSPQAGETPPSPH